MNAEYYQALAEHLEFIRKAHKREMAKLNRSLKNPTPLICSCCKRKIAEKHRLMPGARPALRVVSSRN